jgi:endoglucanase
MSLQKKTTHILLFLTALLFSLAGADNCNATDWLITQNNKIHLSDGTIWMGRGANIHDTRSCNACTWQEPSVEEVKRRIDELVDVWGANFIRLCLESYSNQEGRVHWQSILNDPAYLAAIKELVDHVGTKPNTYVLLSIWLDPSLSPLGWPTSATNSILEKLISEFIDSPHVIFGVSNEPENNLDGLLNEECWIGMNNAVTAIRTIEAQHGGKKHLISVQGHGNWARMLDYYQTHPITAGGGENIVYEVHVYDPPAQFQNIFIAPSQTLPVIIGEFGPTDGYLTMEAAVDMMDIADQLQIPYLAWTFHMRCPPSLLVDHSIGGCGINMALLPTAWGQLVKDRLEMYKVPVFQPDLNSDNRVDAMDLQQLITNYGADPELPTKLQTFASEYGKVKPDNATPTSLTLYDGEAVPFSAGTTCDSNSSTITDSTLAPLSGTNHLRLNINVTNWWGAAGYAPSSWQVVDSSQKTTLHLAAKADKNITVLIYLSDTTTQTNSAYYPISLTSTYQDFQIPINFAAFNLITLAISHDGTSSYQIDMDNIYIQ